MPSIPTYRSQETLKVQQREPLRKEAGEKFEPFKDLSNTLVSIEADWRETKGVMEMSNAKAFHSQRIAEIQSKAKDDPDFNNSSLYISELQKANSDSLDMINNKKFRNIASFDFNKDTTLASIKIDNDFKQKTIANWGVSLSNLLTAEANRDFATIAEKQEADESTISYIASGFSKGLIDAKTAQKMGEDYFEKQMNNDIFRDPRQFLDRANTGWYDFIDDKQKGEKIRKAERLIQNGESYAKWQMNQNDISGSYQLSNALMQGNLTEDLIEQLRTSGMIKDDTAAIFTEVLLNGKFDIPDSTKLGKPDYFLRLIDKALAKDSDPKDILSDAARAYGRNELGLNQYAYFIEGAKERIDRKNQKGLGERLRNFKFNYDNIKNLASSVYVPAMYVEKTADMMRRVMDKMSGGSNVDDATDEVMKEELEGDIIKLSESDSELESFASFEEAEAADLPVGTRILIDGVEYEVE